MELAPKQIVEELDKYIIGQDKAKRAVAIAIRNRYRRSRVSDEMKDEITPKNIIMRGPTGVGKTEIARRLAKLVNAPFIKVEATKYTEVGYVGRDVESMVRDLVEMSVKMVNDENLKKVEGKARPIVDKMLVDALINKAKARGDDVDANAIEQNYKNGKCENEIIDIEMVESAKPLGIIDGGMAEINIGSFMEGLLPKRKKKKSTTVSKARQMLLQIESNKMIDNENVNAEAIKRAEESGIIFIDEMDKIIDKSQSSGGPNVSREGVQRDILPIVEGCTVNTKYGMIKTDYILFIAAGAFHISKIEDMIPELQGRFPIRVDLENLTKDDFIKILTTPKNALTLQYKSMLAVDNINLIFTDDALDEIAQISAQENESSENIGARRLHAVLEQLLEDISYNASGNNPMIDVTIDRAYVQNAFKSTRNNYNLKKYVL